MSATPKEQALSLIRDVLDGSPLDEQNRDDDGMNMHALLGERPSLGQMKRWREKLAAAEKLLQQEVLRHIESASETQLSNPQ